MGFRVEGVGCRVVRVVGLRFGVKGEGFEVLDGVGCLWFRDPQKALRGGIPCSFLEPFARSWSHFVGICRQKLSKSWKIDF